MHLRVNGGARLVGTVTVSGSKNAALGLMAAATLVHGETVLQGVPKVTDVELFRAILEEVGVPSYWAAPNLLVLRGGELLDRSPTPELVRQMRASCYLLGPMLARLGRAAISLPGGCCIGARPIDLHLRAFEALGATTRIDSGTAMVEAERLRGAEMSLDGPYGSSVGATINAMLAACVTPGVTRIRCAAREPEVWEVADLLNRAGARITGVGTRLIEIEGVAHLSPVEHTVSGDRIEAGTFLLAAAATGGDVTVNRVAPWMLDGLLNPLLEMACRLETGSDFVRLTAPHRPASVHVETGTFPAMPTDLQPLLVAALSRGVGTAQVSERIFDGRFDYTRELVTMGAQIRIVGSTALVTGVEKLTGAQIAGQDLRGTAALIIGALAAEGVSEVRGLSFLDRGYEGFEENLNGLGARVQREEPGCETPASIVA